MTRQSTMCRTRSALGILLAGLLCWAGCAPTGEDVAPPKGSGHSEAIKGPKIPPKQGPNWLKERVKAALDQVQNRDLLTTHSFWTVFHAILGNGLDAKIRDTFTNQEYNAVEYIRNGGHIKGIEFIVHEKIADGKDGLDVRIGPIFEGQGHQDQYVAEMAQLGLPLDAVFQIKYKTEVRQYKFADFIHYSKAQTRAKGTEELSWTILAVSQYYGTQLSWVNKWGEPVHFEDIVRHEVDQPIETAACGGTHRLFGMTWAYYIHLRDGGKMTPAWQKLDARLKQYYAIARNYQNGDGTFSTEYFRGPGRAPDIERQIGATGHIVEWLALYLPQEELHQQWMQDAVHQLSLLILDNWNKSLDGGALYHAAHGLHLYYWRAWNATDAIPSSKVIPLPPVKK